MPFGLCNAGASFQRLMDIVISGLHPELCLVYLDDIIVFSRTIPEHLERLQLVLTQIQDAGLKLKPEKCSLLQKQVSFLGHLVSEVRISTDERKIDAIFTWPTPISVRELRSFLGLASYYRRFIEHFASIATLLHRLVKSNGAFVWTTEAQRAFERLKEILTPPPILAMTTDDDEFTLDTDASNSAIGAVLSQRQEGVERVVAYASRALDRREQNYCTTRKELLAVVHFVRISNNTFSV